MTDHTERLTLRPVALRDTEAILATRSLPAVAEWIYQPVWTREVAEERVARWVQQQEPGTVSRWIIALATTGEAVGDVFLRKDAEMHGSAETGYVVHPDHAGNGYATEAARAVLHIGFAEWKVHRIYARVDEENLGSVRVCERLGMRREGRLLENDRRGDAWSSELIFALIDREWTRMKKCNT